MYVDWLLGNNLKVNVKVKSEFRRETDCMTLFSFFPLSILSLLCQVWKQSGWTVCQRKVSVMEYYQVLYLCRIKQKRICCRLLSLMMSSPASQFVLGPEQMFVCLMIIHQHIGDLSYIVQFNLVQLATAQLTFRSTSYISLYLTTFSQPMTK